MLIVKKKIFIEALNGTTMVSKKPVSPNIPTSIFVDITKRRLQVSNFEITIVHATCWALGSRSGLVFPRRSVVYVVLQFASLPQLVNIQAEK